MLAVFALARDARFGFAESKAADDDAGAAAAAELEDDAGAAAAFGAAALDGGAELDDAAAPEDDMAVIKVSYGTAILLTFGAMVLEEGVDAANRDADKQQNNGKKPLGHTTT